MWPPAGPESCAQLYEATPIPESEAEAEEVKGALEMLFEPALTCGGVLSGATASGLPVAVRPTASVARKFTELAAEVSTPLAEQVPLL